MGTMSEPVAEVEAPVYPAFDVPVPMTVEVPGGDGLIRCSFPAGTVTPADDGEYACLLHARDAGLARREDDPEPEAEAPKPRRGRKSTDDNTPTGDGAATDKE